MTIEQNAAEKWHWLCREGLAWVDEAAQFDHELEAMRSLRRRLNSWQLPMIIQQLAFRRRAQTRFPDAHRWLWTDRSLQQASDWKSAAFKAQLIPPNQTIVDACCGAGADLVSLAQRSILPDSNAVASTVIGIDCDAQLAELAHANLHAHGLTAELIIGQIPGVFSDLNNHWDFQDHWIHVDPDRRPADRRTTKIDLFSPPLEAILPLVESAAGAIVKLAPATELQPKYTSRFQRGWLGNGGQCRQQLLVRGAQLCDANSRFAVLCDDPNEPQLFFAQPHVDARIACKLRDFVFDFHPVLHASGLQAAFANYHALDAIASSNGYFTGNQPILSPWVQGFRVLDVVSWDPRKLRRWLRLHGVGRVEVKKRLIELDANRFQRELSQQTGQPISLLVTRLADRTVAIASRRLLASDLAVH